VVVEWHGSGMDTTMTSEAPPQTVEHGLRQPVKTAGGTSRGTAGFSLLETIFALGILAVIAMGVLPLGLIAVTTTENQGHLMARSTEYAQDKLEQLLVLAYGDTTSDTRVFPATNAGGSGLAIGGSLNTNAPAGLYVDYLDIDGDVLAAGAGGAPPANWFYQRVWQVSMPAGFAGNVACPLATPPGCLKQVTVTATVRASAAGGAGLIPRATVTALKTFPF
jgi:type II secretory pathway pseudopilin PulG